MADDVEKRRLARNIKALRDKFDVTQQELADVAGVTRQAVVDWEQAKRKAIRQDDVVSAITSYFGITSEDLFSDSGMYAKLHGLTDAPAGAIAAKPSSALVPLLGTTHMGEFEDEGECDRMVEVPASVAEAHPGGFCVRADGECMNNRYPSITPQLRNQRLLKLFRLMTAALSKTAAIAGTNLGTKKPETGSKDSKRPPPKRGHRVKRLAS